MKLTPGMLVDLIYEPEVTVHYIEKKPDKVEFVREYPHYLLFRSWYGNRSYHFCINRGMIIAGEVQIRRA